MNAIYQTKQVDLSKQLRHYDKSTKIIKIEGKEINDLTKYLDVIGYELSFPTNCNDNLDGYYDWMRDLSWIEEKNILLIINNFSDFIPNSIKDRVKVINGYRDIILPFWEDEVERVVVEGKKRKFDVFLVD